MDYLALAKMVKIKIFFIFKYYFKRYYDDGINQLCLKCHLNCQTCKGGTNNDCLISNCHYSCESCNGPLDSNCLSCPEEEISLRKINGTRCPCKDGYFEEFKTDGTIMCVACDYTQC